MEQRVKAPLDEKNVSADAVFQDIFDYGEYIETHLPNSEVMQVLGFIDANPYLALYSSISNKLTIICHFPQSESQRADMKKRFEESNQDEDSNIECECQFERNEFGNESYTISYYFKEVAEV